MTDHDGAPLRVLPTAIAAAAPEVPVPRGMEGERCEVGETHQLLDDGEPYVSEEQRWTDEVMALANERRDANKIARDLTACRSELASIAILMQERNQLPDQGGDNFALVSGAVTTYVLALELGVVALNEEGDDLRTTVTMLWDLMSDDQCIRFSQINPVRYNTVNDLWQKWDKAQKASRRYVGSCDGDCADGLHVPGCPRWDAE